MRDTSALDMRKPKIHKQKAAIMQLTMNVASVALGMEALEGLLIEKGVLKDNELMEKLEKVTQAHYAKDEMIPAEDD